MAKAAIEEEEEKAIPNEERNTAPIIDSLKTLGLQNGERRK